MRFINLLPKSEQKETQLQFFSRSQTLFWVWVAITLVMFLAGTFAARLYLTTIQKQTVKDIVEKQKSLQTSDNEQLKTEVNNINQQIRVIKSLESQHVYWSKGFEELGRLFNPDLQIDLISVDRATGKVELLGKSTNRDSVIAFWSGIHKSKYFKNINFPLSNLERANNTNFTFTFYVNMDELKQE